MAKQDQAINDVVVIQGHEKQKTTFTTFLKRLPLTPKNKPTAGFLDEFTKNVCFKFLFTWF